MFVFVVAAGCSDDDSTPGDAGTDGGPGSGGGESGEGGGGSGGSGGRSGAGGSSPTGGSGTGGSGTGGSGTGGSGGSGATDGGTDDGGTGGRCGDVTCDPLATCDESGDEPTCECPFGYDDVSGFGTKCEEHDPPLCMDDGDCDSDHCVDGVCCESACDEPPACHTDDGATCEDGETCVYPELEDGTACDDDDLCTDDDECNDGECDGTTADCDDDNVCTADDCDSEAIDVDDRCVNDGTGITTAGCALDTMCEMDFACEGNARGDCNPDPLTVVDCIGSDDQCNVGECNPSTGGCVAVPLPNGTACDDEDACNDGETCQAGNCTGGGARVCDDGNVCTTESCDSTDGCQYTNNTVSCTDSDPCTVNEQCSGGSCNDVDPKNCSSENDQCNDGVCQAGTGTCVKQAKSGSAIACNDSNNCTNSETCSAGSCIDSNTDSACGAGSLSCDSAPADPRMCTCDTGNDYTWDMTTRTCKADVCDPTPCSANATCSESGGSAFCTCNPGYVDTNGSTDPVTGVTCGDLNACAGNPCGAAGDTCTDEPAPALGYTCTCDAGFTDVDATNNGKNDPVCVCDMDGTFAIRIRTDLAWSGLDNISNGTETTYSWAIREHTYDDAGQLQVVTTSCGGTTPELCGDGASASLGGPPAQAYAQFVTNGVWQQPGMPVEDVTISLANPQPGGAFVNTSRAVLLGIQLTNPMGTWPVSHCAVSGTLASECGGTVTPVNGATWTNPDGDTLLGITTNAVPPGGINIDNTPPDPPCADIAGTDPSCPNYELTGGADAAYPSVSAVCPRSGGGGALPYAYFPGLSGFTIYKDATGIKRFSVASRVISGFDGTFASCDRVTGDVTGPDTDGPDADTNGEMRTDARIFDCVRGCTGGAGCVNGEISCSEGLAEFFDNTTGACTTAGNCDAGYRCNNGRCEAQRLTDASFIIKRVPAGLISGGLSCAEIRAMDFN